MAVQWALGGSIFELAVCQVRCRRADGRRVAAEDNETPVKIDAEAQKLVTFPSRWLFRVFPHLL
jgi:hypothetical protein